MNYLTPAQMPVSAFLANKYAVCDQWFGSAPTQTYANRAFALCAAPGVDHDGKFSFIDDLQYIVHKLSPIPSVLGQLDAVLGGAGETGPFWKVYFQDYSVAVATVPQVAAAAASHDNVNLGTFDNSDWGTEKPKQLTSTTSTFVADLQANALPPFCFIEPRYFDSYAPTGLPTASNHPGRGNFPGGLFGSATPIDAATGEVFLMQIYNLLQASPGWSETLLIVTYDEHGGVYDHVPPPLATSPGANIPPVSDLLDRTANGFNYNVLGCRVPAIVVSPQISSGATIRAAPANTIEPPCGKAFFDHSSIVRTVWDIFGLSEGGNGLPSLTGRDLAAPSLATWLTGQASNMTGAFSGVIVAGAGSLTFTHTHDTFGTPGPQFILASAGPFSALTVTASQPTGEIWLSADAGAAGAANVYTIKVTVDIRGLQEGSYSGSVTIAASGVEKQLSIPVTLTIKPLL
jgi:phospholipase C